jgi:hypothetical protein
MKFDEIFSMMIGDKSLFLSHHISPLDALPMKASDPCKVKELNPNPDKPEKDEHRTFNIERRIATRRISDLAFLNIQ